ncbi:MAG TPA: dihydrolipoamide acetyltransferase family protein [Hyphomicrobiales bacterium]|nr:dihydrolipoamide acetyltransferase family protein [Hyphomicrobiales bacterium]
MTDFLMPSLGADMETGTVVEWRVKPGSPVKKGDVIAVVETHKGAIEVECFEEGTVSELCVEEGEEVPVGALLARLNGAGEPAAQPEPGAKVEEKVPPPAKPVRAPRERAPEGEAAPQARPKITPAARRRAAERGLDPATLKGTGIDGSVTLADVEAAAPSAVARPPAEAAEPAVPPRKAKRGFDPDQMRQAIAAAMSRSTREIPHYDLTSTVDLGRATGWLEDFNRDRAPDERLLPAVLLLKATALALARVPQLNGFWEDGAFRPGPGVHLGWAISLRGGGLVAPAIHEADRKSLPDLMAALRDLVGRARAGGLRSSELIDPSVTITSLGGRGADSVIGVIYPPQVAIVGFGRIAERPWVADGEVTARPLVSVSLSADHRASDGHTGGKLLAAIDYLLHQPEAL